MSDTLKPCPFCGGTNFRVLSICVICNECEADGPEASAVGGKAESIAAWNKRAEPGIDPEPLIAACLPGGSVCDPQQVADAIRRYCAAPAPAITDAMVEAAAAAIVAWIGSETPAKAGARAALEAALRDKP